MLCVAGPNSLDLQRFDEKRCTTVHSRKLNRCMQSGQSQPPLAHVITFLGTGEMENAHFKNDPAHFNGMRLGLEPPQKAFISAFTARVEAALISTDLSVRALFPSVELFIPQSFFFFLHRHGIAAQLIFGGMIWCDRREQKATDWLLQRATDLSDRRALDCTMLQSRS